MKYYFAPLALVLTFPAFAQTTPTPTTEQLQQTIIDLQRQILANQTATPTEQPKPELTIDEINQRKAEAILKKNLKDPDSYQQIGWTHFDYPSLSLKTPFI